MFLCKHVWLRIPYSVCGCVSESLLISELAGCGILSRHALVATIDSAISLPPDPISTWHKMWDTHTHAGKTHWCVTNTSTTPAGLPKGFVRPTPVNAELKTHRGRHCSHQTLQTSVYSSCSSPPSEMLGGQQDGRGWGRVGFEGMIATR